MAIQRAEDKTEQMKARAGALDELMASGALDDQVSGPSRRHPGQELDRMGASHDVDAELERMKTELAPGSAPRQIEATGPTAPDAAEVPPARAVQPADQPPAGDGA